MIHNGPSNTRTNLSSVGGGGGDGPLHGLRIVAAANNAQGPDSNESSLLLTCARRDNGGGVSLGSVFAIYSTAILPPEWTSILHAAAPPPSATEIYARELRALAHGISLSFPIYTSWTDVKSSHLIACSESHDIQSLNMTTPPSSTSTTPPKTSITTSISSLSNNRHANTKDILARKPHFLINSALFQKHCIVGQGSHVETLLVVLRRPWCVLEICVSDTENTHVLEAILEFAKTARKKDYYGYSTAVFLLEHEIISRKRRQRCLDIMALQQQQREALIRDSWAVSARKESFISAALLLPPPPPPLSTALSSMRVYELCNTVFLSSLSSFNSFWIRLICVSAIEAGVSYSSLISGLCDQKKRKQIQKRTNGEEPLFSPRIMLTSLYPHARRRQSDVSTELTAWWRNARNTNMDEYSSTTDDYGSVEKMIEVYKDVSRRAADTI